MQDDKGQDVDFKNTIILLTSNVGTDTIMKVCADPDTKPDAAGLNDALRPDRTLDAALEPVAVAVEVATLARVPWQLVGRLEGERAGDERAHPGHHATPL